MRSSASLVLAVTTLVVATPAPVVNRAFTTVPEQGGDLRTQCQGLALLCCDALKEKDVFGAGPGTGIFRNCHGIHDPYIFDLDDLSTSCEKTPACCDMDVLSGPPLKTLQCTSLEVTLAQGPGIVKN